MKDRINTYFAVLIITIAGAGAAGLIVHVSVAKTPVVKTDYNEASSSDLKESILKLKP